MADKLLPEYVSPQITTFTDEDIIEEMGEYHGNYVVIITGHFTQELP